MKNWKFRWTLAVLGFVLSLVFIELPALRGGGDMAGYVPLLPSLLCGVIGFVTGLIFDFLQKFCKTDKPKSNLHIILWFLGTLAVVYLVYLFLSFLGIFQFFIGLCVTIFGLYKTFSK